jgi:HAMP domain-containing protein
MALAATRGARKSGVAKSLARRPKVKIDSGDVAKAAKEVGNFSAQVGELANELRRARESADGKKHRSPVEVVLQGLTARR